MKGGVLVGIKETMFTTVKTEATFQLLDDGQTNPTFHMGSARIFAIDTVANNVKFSKESTINALPTLKNIPIVTLYKDDEQNFGDHEVICDKEGMRYGTYPIGLIPESAEQWIEEVHTPEGVKQYLCSDVILWKRQKKEFQLIKSQGTFPVSMEVGMVDYEFNSSKVCEVSQFYFTAVAVLGNGVNPAFKDACINFTKVGVFQDMMLELKEYMKQFEGGFSMAKQKPTNTFENEPQDPQVGEGRQTQSGTQPENGEPQATVEPTTVEPNTTEPKEDYKALLEKAEAEYGRTIAELTKERDDLTAKVSNHEEEKKALEDSHKTELEALKEELESLKTYKKEIEDKQRKEARDNIISQITSDFPELVDCEDYKKLLENEELGAEDLENKAYAIVGKLEREKRGGKRKVATPQSNRVPLTNPTNTNKDKKASSPYGGLLIK